MRPDVGIRVEKRDLPSRSQKPFHAAPATWCAADVQEQRRNFTIVPDGFHEVNIIPRKGFFIFELRNPKRVI